jgi:hypothetical protein
MWLSVGKWPLSISSRMSIKHNANAKPHKAFSLVVLPSWAALSNYALHHHSFYILWLLQKSCHCFF